MFGLFKIQYKESLELQFGLEFCRTFRVSPVNNHILMTFSFHTGFYFHSTIIGSLSSQTRLKQNNRQAGKQQPTLPLQAAPSLSKNNKSWR